MKLIESIFGPGVCSSTADRHVMTVAGNVLQNCCTFAFVHGEIEHEVRIGVLHLFLHVLGNLGSLASGFPHTHLSHLDNVDMIRTCSEECNACEVEDLACATVAAVHLNTVHVENHIACAGIECVGKVNPFAPLQRIAVGIAGVVVGINTHSFDLKEVVEVSSILVGINHVAEADVELIVGVEAHDSLVVDGEATVAGFVSNT